MGVTVLIQGMKKMKIRHTESGVLSENILEKFRYIKEMGFDGFEIDGKLLVNNIEEVKRQSKKPVYR